MSAAPLCNDCSLDIVPSTLVLTDVPRPAGYLDKSRTRRGTWNPTRALILQRFSGLSVAKAVDGSTGRARSSRSIARGQMTVYRTSSADIVAVARREKEEGSAGAVRDAKFAHRLHHRLRTMPVGRHGEYAKGFPIQIAAIYAARIAFVEKVA